jgi:uncharacterized repeat protein (TIGR01451 family)
MTLSAFALLAPVGSVAADPAPMGTSRVVIFEQFTAGGCGFCPPVSQGLGMMEANYERDEVVILSYHGTMGGDPLAHPSTPTRMGIYGFGGYPSVAVDGTLHKVGGGGTAQQQYNALNNLYNQRTGVLSELKLTIEGDLNPQTEKGDIWVNISAVDTVTEDNLVLHVVVFENDVDYNAPNGETVHDFVVRSFLDGTNGKSISISQGQSLSNSYQFDFPTNQDPNEVGVIAFVQTTDRTASGNYFKAPILQAAYINVIPLPNVPPVISFGQVVAPVDATEDDDVTFKMFYRDPDDAKDNGPSEAKVFYKNDTSSVMSADLTPIPSSDNWMEGKWLSWTTKLDPGTYSYRFNASDGEDHALGDFEWNTTRITIKPRNKVPELMSHGFGPQSGDTNTKFRFDIMYRDRDGEEATTAKVVINDVEYDMLTDSTGPWTEWQYFYYETTMPVGDMHRFFYRFSDGIDEIRYPLASASPNWILGPEVEPPNNEPTLTTPIFSPKEGTRESSFEFTVIYTDGENDHPTVSYVYIDEVPNIMMSTSYNYVGGAQFRFTTRLDLGTHYYYFVFNDGKHEVRLPAAGSLEGPTVTNIDPEAAYEAPTDGARYTPDQYVPFSAVSADDPEGDELTYEWVSDIDGPLSSNEAFDKRLSEGLHTVTLTVTDEHGGTDSLTFQVLIKPYVPRLFIDGYTASVDTPVEQDTISYTVTIDNDGEIRASGVNVRFLVDDVEVSSDTVSVEVNSPVQVRFTWTSVAGDHDIRFEVGTDSLDFVQTVTANTLPTVDIGILTVGKPVTKYKTGKEINFQANSGDANGDDLTYLWDFGDGVTSFMENPIHMYSKAGTYIVTLTVTDARGGTFSDTFEVVVTKPKADDSPGFGALLAASAMLLALLGAAYVRRRH